MKKRFKLIEGFMENILLTLKDQGIIRLCREEETLIVGMLFTEN